MFIEFIYLNISSLISFMVTNKYILILLLIIWLGICFDRRFTLLRKLQIPIFFFFFIEFILYFRGNFIIEELFWYTLVINGAFIFHVLLCHWIFNIFNSMKWDYGCFLISRLSFILSLSFFMYILNILYLWIILWSKKNKIKVLYYLGYIPITLIKIIQIILIFFIKVFTNISLLYMGNLLIRYNLFSLIKLAILFLVTFIISIVYLGIPRLYFIWIMLIFIYIFKILINYNKNNNEKLYIFINKYIINIDKPSFSFIKNPLSSKLYHIIYYIIYYIEEDLNYKIDDIKSYYKKAYSKKFIYGFFEFVNWTNVTLNGTPLRFHLEHPFKYYSKEELIVTYIKCYYDYFKGKDGKIQTIYLKSAIVKAADLFELAKEDIQILEEFIWIDYKNVIKPFDLMNFLNGYDIYKK